MCVFLVGLFATYYYYVTYSIAGDWMCEYLISTITVIHQIQSHINLSF